MSRWIMVSAFVAQWRRRMRHHTGMSLWRRWLFRFLETREHDAADYYGIPQERVSEIDVPIDLGRPRRGTGG